MATEDSSANDRTLCLVCGYHAHSYPPVDAYELGLRHRFAVVLDTYRRDKVDMYFDADLFLRLVPAICQEMSYDRVDIWMCDERHFYSFDAFARHLVTCEEVDRSPPQRITLAGKGLLGIIETEFWAAIGGPAPYHDSYTLSFYTATDRSAAFQLICERVCTEVGAVITGIHRERQSNEPYRSWWKRVLRWITLTKER